MLTMLWCTVWSRVFSLGAKRAAKRTAGGGWGQTRELEAKGYDKGEDSKDIHC